MLLDKYTIRDSCFLQLGIIQCRGVCKLAAECHKLELLSLHGIRGVTDATIDSLAQSCGATLTTLDVNGCIGIQRRSKEDLRAKLPKLTCFVVHT